MLAGPESSDAPFEDSAEGSLSSEKPWFRSIKRIILLAGMNRGWRVDHHLSIPRAIGMKIGCVYGDFLLNLTGKRPIVFHSRRGAAFLTDLRLQWLALQRHMDDMRREKPITVQLLGTVDDLVAPDDNVDSGHWTRLRLTDVVQISPPPVSFDGSVQPVIFLSPQN